MILVSSPIYCQSSYEIAFSTLKNGLEDRNLAFKDAVFLTEDTYFDNTLYRQEFDDELGLLAHLVRMREKNDSLIYKGKDLAKIKTNSAMFRTLTDTTIALFYDTAYYVFMPYRYDFDDIFGSKDWSNMFVTKLLRTRKGNCHSLPYLYKMLADELGVKAYLSLSPNHIYIKQRAEKGGWYNTELTSATFPIDTWLMASGYISLQAVQNGIYLDTLSEKESIALCVLDLAQGYNHKYPDNDGKFIIECCDLALKHFPDYVNAILLKAETRLKQLQAMQKEMKYPYLKEVTGIPEGKAKWDEMNSLYMQLYKLGYRQMPEQMYVEWLTSLKTEKEKYSNKNAPGATKD
ncbi:MAG: hypothetical protein KIS77_13245 [Saprospiraceae bacterium]|nr:hypothetical protein [Saprospiraceae bacterium]